MASSFIIYRGNSACLLTLFLYASKMKIIGIGEKDSFAQIVKIAFGP